MPTGNGDDSAPACLARDFSRDYELLCRPALRALERKVLGCDYGATSWTTRREAARIARLLELQPRTRLLDVGAGSGWPGLYFAELTGCEVVLADVPVVGLRIARERARTDGIQTRCHAVAADGAALPFRNASFDALSHSDVLCCMPQKLELLQECRRVARPHADMAFSVILPAPGLSTAGRRRAIRAGPPFVDVPADYEVLLHQSRWQIAKRNDVTKEYLQSLQVSLREMQSKAASVRAVLGAQDFANRLERRRHTIAAIEQGALKRELFHARALD